MVDQLNSKRVFIGNAADRSANAGFVPGDRFLEKDTDGYYLYDGGAWAQLNGGGGSPGGADSHVQYNDGGNFGGDGSFTWNKTTKTLTLSDAKATANLIINTSGDDNQASIQFGDGTNTYVFGVNETDHGIWLGSGTDLTTLPLFGIDSNYFYLGGDSSSYRMRVDPSGGEVLLRINTIFHMPGFSGGGEVFYAEGDSFGIGRSSSSRMDVYEPEGSYPLYERHGANLDAIGSIVEQSFYADDSTGAETDYVKMIVYIDDPTNGSEDGSVTWSRMIGGALTDVFVLGSTNQIIGDTDIVGDLFIGPSGNYAQIGDAEIVFNPEEADRDFRVAGDGVSGALFVDASTGYVAVGTESPSAKLTVMYDYSDAAPSQAVSVATVWSPATTTGSVFPTAMVLVPTYDSTHSPSGGFLTSFRLFANIADSGVLSIRNVDIRSSNNGSGTVDNITDIRVRSAVNDGGGAVTNYYAVYVENQTAAGNNYGFYQLGTGVQNVLQGSLVVGSPSGGNPGAGAVSLDAQLNLDEMSATPTSPASGASVNIYMKADKLIFQFNQGGTVRYKYLDLTGTGVTWVHTTTAP